MSLESFSIDAINKNLDIVLDRVKETLKLFDCDKKDMYNILLCVEEVFVNISNYAYQNGLGTVKISYGVDEGNNFIIKFIDAGIKYDPLAREGPDTTLSVEDRNIGGLGIFLCKKLMDSLHYEYLDGKNTLSMQKVFKV